MTIELTRDELKTLVFLVVDRMDNPQNGKKYIELWRKLDSALEAAK